MEDSKLYRNGGFSMGTMGTIKALCISEKKGTLKTSIHKALFHTEWGMVGDAHAGRWHRQISL